MNTPVDSFRSPYESDNEWELRRQFLENNFYKFPKDRLVCLSMCYINHVSYGVTYSPGVMSQLRELSQGLPLHLDIVKEKNNIAFVKPKNKKKENGLTYEKFIKPLNPTPKNSLYSTNTGKYTNFVLSKEASFQPTWPNPGAGLGFGSAGSTDDSKTCFSTNIKPSTNTSMYPGFGSAGSTDKSKTCFSTNATKYPGFVNSGSTVSEDSKPCFAVPTGTVNDMLMYSGFIKSEPKISPAENLNASSNNNNKYLKMIKPNPNSYIGSQTKVPSTQYRSKPVLKTPQETSKSVNTPSTQYRPNPVVKAPQDTPKSDVIAPPAKKTLLTTPPEAAATTTTDSTSSSQELGAIEVTYLEKNFYTLSENLIAMKAPSGPANAIQMMNMALSKLKMYINTDIKPVFFKTSKIFVCRIQIANVQLGDGTGSNKKTAKHQAFTKAFNLLTKPTLKIEEQNGQQVLVGSNQPRPDVNKMIVTKPSGTIVPTRKSWGHFLIMENKTVNNAIAVLRRSADINKVSVKYAFWPDPKGMACQIRLNGEPIMLSIAETKSMAKTAVSEKALLWLKQRCWTIVVKQAADSDNIDVTREEIMGEIEKQFKPIPSDNVGNQLLRKMGWKGGGIGAEGNKGIEDPITVNQVIDRQGLGCHSSSGVSTKFNTYVREILLKYVKSKKQKDLVFTSEFSKEERAIIHQEARRYNLKSNSRGNGEDRHLIISRKRSAGQLFNHILASGGATQKYELIPPLNKNL